MQHHQQRKETKGCANNAIAEASTPTAAGAEGSGSLLKDGFPEHETAVAAPEAPAGFCFDAPAIASPAASTPVPAHFCFSAI